MAAVMMIPTIIPVTKPSEAETAIQVTLVMGCSTLVVRTPDVLPVTMFVSVVDVEATVTVDEVEQVAQEGQDGGVVVVVVVADIAVLVVVRVGQDVVVPVVTF